MVKLAGEQTAVSKSKIYIENVAVNDSETFFIENSAMIEVINKGIEMGKQNNGDGSFTFDVDYGYLRKLGNESEKKYDANDITVLKESLAESITAGGFGSVTDNRAEADYAVSININTLLVICEGSMSTKGVAGYSFDIVNLKNESDYFKQRSFIFENLKVPMKSSINTIILEEVLSELNLISGGTAVAAEAEKKYKNVSFYENIVTALLNFKVVRSLTHEEGDKIYKYKFPMDWYRFFYAKK